MWVLESALASLEVMLVEELREAGGMSRMVDFNFFLGGFLGALGVHFASFFRFRFLHRFFIDFFSISEGFWEGFGRAKRSKNRDFGCFWEYAFRDLNFGRILFEF